MKLIDKWQARHAQKLLEQAKREVTDPRPRKTFRVVLAWLLSALVLATPYVVMAGGVVLILATFFSVSATIIGLILVGFGYVLLPPRWRNTQETYRREDLPKLFALQDEIAKRLGTQAPVGVH